MIPVEGGREGGREEEEFCQWALNVEEEDEEGREGGAKSSGGICSCSRRRRSFKCPYLDLSLPVCLPGTEGRRTACAS